MTKTGVVVVAVVSMLLAGCGGEDERAASPARPDATAAREPPTRSGDAPTRPEFIREADALCAAAKRRVAPITRAVDAKVADEDAAGVATQLKKALPLADAFLRRMRALTPPRGDEAVVGRYLDIVAEQRRRIPALVEALEAEDISTVEVLAEELRQGNRRARRLVLDYGLTKCGPGNLPSG